MKAKSKKILSLLTVAAILVTSIHSPLASDKTVEGITATYADDEVYVGSFVDSNKVDVSLVYSDGTTESIGSNCTIKNQEGNPIVSNEGSNPLDITYTADDGTEYTTTLDIWGYKENSIKATYTGEDILVGNMFASKDVVVELVYTNHRDGSAHTETMQSDRYTIVNANNEANPTVTDLGYNTFTVTASTDNNNSFSTTVDVWGYKFDKVEAEYTGSSIIVGNKYNKDDVKVYDVYTPYSNSEVRKDLVSSFTVNSQDVTTVGTNTFTATAANGTANFNVTGYELQVEGLTVVYSGSDVFVGRDFNKSSLEVIVTYSDGTSAPVTEYKLNSQTVTKVGENVFTVTYGNHTATFSINGYDVSHLEAKYVGGDIKVGETFLNQHLSVRLYYTENDQIEYDEVGYLFYTLTNANGENSAVVSKAGKNTFTVTGNEGNFNGMTATFDVWGYDVENMTAEYTGKDILVGNEFDPKNIEITLNYTEYSDGTAKTEKIAIENCIITDANGNETTLISNSGTNQFKVTYGNYHANITVWGYAPSHIEAEYTGNNILVGSQFNSKDVTAKLVYTANSDGTVKTETIETNNYTLVNANNEADPTVTAAGNNTFTIKYNNVTGTINVWGYKLDRIEAEYTGETVRVSNSYDKTNVNVTAFYTERTDNGIISFAVDNSDFSVNSLLVTTVGDNTYTATYKSLTANFTVEGYNDTVTISSIIAEYNGEDILVGSDFDKNDIVITINYSDGTTGTTTENFEVNSTTVTTTKNNAFTVTYEGVSTTVNVWGYQPSYIEANYVGSDILVGNQFAAKDVEIILYYTANSDGTVKEEEITENFTLLNNANEANPTVTTVEYNIFTVVYDGLDDTIKVWGYKPVALDVTYNGSNILVNNTFKSSDITVKVVYTPYSDGTKAVDTIDVKNCKITNSLGQTSTKVLTTGNNEYVVSYGELTGAFTVWGYELVDIEAEYTGADVLVGKNFNKADVNIIAHYTERTDGESSTVELAYSKTNFSGTTVSTTGWNEYTITYSDGNRVTDIINVWGYTPSYIEAEYNGTNVLTGDKVSNKNITVTLYYTPYHDNTVETTTLTTGFTVLNENGTSVVEKTGYNTFTVNYNNMTDTIDVWGYAPDYIKAEYVGSDILVGKQFNSKDVQITLYYTEASTGEVATKTITNNFTVTNLAGLADPTVTAIEYNTFTINYNGLTDTIKVWGYQPSYLDATYAGGDILVGNKFANNKISAVLYYTAYSDGTVKSENISYSKLTFDTTVNAAGNNKVTVAYGELTDTVDVWGYAPSYIDAVYNGKDILVGDDIDVKDVSAILYYTPYSDDTVKSEAIANSKLSIADTTVKAAGNNEVVVAYGEMTDTVNVWGYQPSYIEANYVGNDILVGNQFASKDVEITLFYTANSDGTVKEEEITENFTLLNSANEANPTVTTVEYNTFVVDYNGLTDEINVWGYAPSYITAEYVGSDILVGNNFAKEDLIVKLFYTPYSDKTVKEEVIASSDATFDIAINNVGNNTVNVTYKEFSAIANVWGYGPSYIKADYVGGDILVGDKFDSKDLAATLYYTPYKDGTVKEESLDASQLTFDATVKAAGNNKITVAYNKLTDTVDVWGYAPSYIDAIYNGKDILVGENFDVNDISTILYYTPYSNGTIKDEVIAGKDLTVDTVIKAVENNEITVAYGELTDTVDVWGYAPSYIDAVYNGKDILVGDDVDVKDVSATLYYTKYSDGTVKSEEIANEDLSIADATIIATKNNKVVVAYGEMTDTVDVWGYAPSYIKAEYVGSDILVGNQFASKDVEITLFYTEYSDGTVKEEAIDENFTIVNSANEADVTVTAVEYNTFVVNYNGLTDEINVWGYRPIAIKATYSGPDIFVGNTFSSKDVKVELIYTPYSDKTTKVEEIAVENCTIVDALDQVNTKVLTAGTNEYTVKYNDLTTTLDVWGYKVDKVEAKYSGSGIVVGNKYSKDNVKVTAAFTAYSNGKVETINVEKFDVDSLDVKVVGNNTYKATCEYGEASFTVEGLRTNNVIKLVAVDGNGNTIKGIELVYAIGDYKGTLVSGGTDTATLGINTAVALENLTVGIPSGYKLTDKSVVAEDSTAFTTYTVKITVAEYDPNEVKTGDESNAMIYIALGGSSLLALAYLALSKKKKEDDAK